MKAGRNTYPAHNPPCKGSYLLVPALDFQLQVRTAGVVYVFSYSKMRNNGISTITKSKDICFVDERCAHTNVTLDN